MKKAIQNIAVIILPFLAAYAIVILTFGYISLPQILENGIWLFFTVIYYVFFIWMLLYEVNFIDDSNK